MWQESCSEPEGHIVPCCEGGSGTIQGVFGGEPRQLAVTRALQSGCPGESYELEARDADSLFTLKLDFAAGMVSVREARYVRDESGLNTVYGGGAQAIDLQVTIRQPSEWAMEGSFSGTLGGSVDLELTGDFDVQTVYFDWAPD